MDYSENFYRTHAQRYAEVAEQLLQATYIRSSLPALTGDLALIERLKDLVPGRRGLDAGCGAGARDVHDLWESGYDITGIDAIEENIQVAKELHPAIADRISVADLRNPLDFPDEFFDFVMCNSVIQHIEPENVFGVTLGEFARVLRPRGVLQLMFKNGSGQITVYDRDYDVDRSFQLYEENELLESLAKLGLHLVAAENPEQLGGLMYFTDPKPVDYCVFYLRKSAT